MAKIQLAPHDNALAIAQEETEMPKVRKEVPKSVPKVTVRTRETAETMATKQKDIAVSEFFAKNRHLLGFDNPRKALLTTVKEAVDNSLDACEEAGILPNVTIVIEDLQPDRPANAKPSRYRVTVVDTARASCANRCRGSSAACSTARSSTA